jgi:hypothetical protein
MRRVLLVVMAASVMSLGFVAGPAEAAKTKKITNCKKDKALNENVAKAFDAYLSGDTTAQKMLYVEDGSKIAPISDKGSAAAAAAGQTSTGTTTLTFNVQATCDGKKAATFTYDLATGIPKPVTAAPTKGLGLNFAGDAVLDKKKGIWLVSGATICDLIGKNPNTPTLGAECLTAIGG